MLDELLEHATSNKTLIQHEIKGLSEDFDVDAILKTWKERTPKQRTCDMIAEDGSFNYMTFKSFSVYAVGVETVLYENGVLSRFPACDVDILRPYKYTRNRLRLYMSILENKAVLNTSKNVDPIDLALIDGSILGSLIRPAAFTYRPNAQIRSFIEGNLLPKIEEDLTNNCSVEILSKKLSKELTQVQEEIKTSANIYLEYLEHLLVLSKLFDLSDKIVSISKLSRSTDYFHHQIPDMALFESFTRSSGYSEPLRVPLAQKRIKRAFPILDALFRKQILTIFYVRLEDKKTVLKIECIGSKTSDELEFIFDNLAGIAVEGYPYLLRRAHRDVVISNKDMHNILRILGIYEKTGREML
ncbi:MAG: DNA double-strand break repair nuclease NurA, partial [Candidatus Helarchaeota archaeon]|nr:DNA double-strand break repair nuclease NurA [Candidatus Helarchaeota archaeon]